MNIINWKNNWSWGAKKSGMENMEQILEKPNNENLDQLKYYIIRDKIIETVQNNKFPDNLDFDDILLNVWIKSKAIFYMKEMKKYQKNKNLYI